MKKQNILIIAIIPVALALAGTILSLANIFPAMYGSVWNLLQPFFLNGALPADRILNIIFILLFIGGIYKYARNSENYRILLFCFITAALQAGWMFIQILLFTVLSTKEISTGLFLVVLFKSLGYAFFFGTAAKALMKFEIPDFESRNLEHNQYKVFTETPLNSRAVGWIADILVLLIVFIYSAMILYASAKVNSGEDSGSFWIAMIDLGILFIYFSASEMVFGTTPGKALTGSRVYTEQGHTPAIINFIIRNLIRLVPLEPLSFLFYRNWHDEWSGTRVYRVRQKEDAERIWDTNV